MIVVRQRGFGLLEAIVALAIIGIGGVVMFDWVRQDLALTERARQRDRDTYWKMQALAQLQAINPALQPAGEQELQPGIELAWNSEPIRPMTMVQPLPGGTATRFDVGLFRLQARISGRALAHPVYLELNRLGVRQRDL